MKIKKMISVASSCLLVILVVVVSCLIFIVNSSANSISNAKNDLIDSNFDDGGSYVSFESTKVHFSNEENISVSYLVSSEYEISDISYIQEGLRAISIVEDADNSKRLLVETLPEFSHETHHLAIEIELTSGELLSADLYVITNEYGSFVNPFSEDVALQEYFKYALDTGIMTKNEYDEIWAELSRKNVIFDYLLEETIVNFNGNTTLNNASGGTVVSGTLYWVDDLDVSHPLNLVLVEIYVNNSSGGQTKVSTHTDYSGYFSYTITNSANGEDDVFIRVYAGDENARVKIGDTDNYYYFESSVFANVSNNSRLTCNATLSLACELRKPFQISQALLTARKFAWEMMGEKPEAVTVRYPSGDNCSYRSLTKTIRITGNARMNELVPHSYASWDTIMHEYGHHVQHIVGNADNPGDRHSSNQNDVDSYVIENDAIDPDDKEKGIKLAWAESWPTVFSLMAQKYYGYLLQNIPTVNDTLYTSYRVEGYCLESGCERRGEACEQSIMAVLWDIFDATNDAGDTISLGHTAFWKITTENQCETFSEFINCFYGMYPEYIDDIGENLTRYHMAPNYAAMINHISVSQTEAPMFGWGISRGSDYFPLNNFYLIFYNSLGEEILRTNTTTETYYTLTSLEWEAVYRSYGRTYTVAVAGVQTSYPETGCYVSMLSETFTKPTSPELDNTTDMLSLITSMYSAERYMEEIVTLEPRQFIDYKIRFVSGGVKLIQTFGDKNTMIYLYDMEMNLLAVENDSGYEKNALLQYNFVEDTRYILRVKFYDSNDSGRIKIAITPASGVQQDGLYSIDDYEDIYSIQDRSNFTWRTYLSQYQTKVITFSAPEDGSYTIQLQSEYDTFLYVIDPRSNEFLVNHVHYDDDSGEGMNGLLTVDLDAEVPYLIIYSALDPSYFNENIELTLKINKNA